MNFTPSIYQQKFYDFVEHGIGNGVINAVAGSGKSTTIVSAMQLIPHKQKCLFIAFNKSIADELGKKLKKNTNVSVRTAHSLGFLMIKRNVGNNIEVDEYKYKTYVRNNILELTTLNDVELKKLSKSDFEMYVQNVISLITFSRFNLSQNEKQVEEMSDKYGVPICWDESKVVLKCLEWGKNNINIVDYTDMIWLPVELSLRPIGLKYDWVFVDECQDMSQLSIQLFLKCLGRGSRFVAVGDNKQAIYGFAGSSEEAFQYMVNYPNTTKFELPISYRCSQKVVELANNYVPQMKARDNAPEGCIKYKCLLSEVKDGDMILSRTKAPLMKAYNKLLKLGYNCYIKGQDIGVNLNKLLLSIDKSKLNKDLSDDGVFVRLYERLFSIRTKLMIKHGISYEDAMTSTPVIEMLDTINTLEVLSKNCTTKTSLMHKIEQIFKEDSDGICLSTIHKSKGLEAENVYILCRSSMPSKLAKQDWEVVQEDNLIYVAYTRAKNKLGFISEDEIQMTAFNEEPLEFIESLATTEKIICKILGTEPLEYTPNEQMTRFLLNKSTDLDVNDLKIENTIIENKNNTNEVIINDNSDENKSNDRLKKLELLLKAF